MKVPSDRDSLKSSMHLGDKMQQQNLKVYKKNLLYKVILVLVILSIFVLERIFYYYLLDYEVELLEGVQGNLGLERQSKWGEVFSSIG